MSANCINCVKNKRTGPDLLCDQCRAESSLAAPAGSVDALKQYVTSAWIEAEAICVDSRETGPAKVMMIFKARDMLRDVLHVLNSSPPNEKGQR